MTPERRQQNQQAGGALLLLLLGLGAAGGGYWYFRKKKAEQEEEEEEEAGLPPGTDTAGLPPNARIVTTLAAYMGIKGWIPEGQRVGIIAIEFRDDVRNTLAQVAVKYPHLYYVAVPSTLSSEMGTKSDLVEHCEPESAAAVQGMVLLTVTGGSPEWNTVMQCPEAGEVQSKLDQVSSQVAAKLASPPASA